MSTVRAELVSPERTLWAGEAEMVVARTEGGDIAFLPGHQPFLGALTIGPVRFLLPDKTEVVAVTHGGFVSVGNDQVIVLSDVAELGEQIDVPRAQRAKERAEAALSTANLDEVAKAEAIAALARANARLAARTLVEQLGATRH